MKHLTIKLTVLLLIFIQSNMLYSQISKDNNVSINNQVDALFTEWNTNEKPGASIAIVKDGAIVYKKGYGMANLEYGIPNSSTTVFHIASISKQFTVFSILLLEEEGKLSLEDDIRKYIPEVPNFGKTITLRHLATHASGLRDQWSLLGLAGWRRGDVVTKAHILKFISKQNALNFNPGEKFLYCNTGFTLLAEVVSRVSGQTFAEFTKANIFEPLQMSSTLFYDDHEKIVQNRAYSYYLGSSGYKKSVLNFANVGATSLFTTVEDLSHWALNFSSTKIGNNEIIRKMNTISVLNNGKKTEVGLGQVVGKYKGLNEIQHGGADAGYRSYFARYPDQNFSVMVFSNEASFKPNKIVHEIVDIYLKDSIKVELKKEALNIDYEAPKKISVSQDILNTYVGNYDIKPGVTFRITIKKGQLFMQAPNNESGLLIPTSKTEFAIKNGKAKISFVTNGSQESLLKLHVNGRIINAEKVEVAREATIKLTDFEGHFYSEELSTEYQFVVIDGQLIVKHKRLSDIILKFEKDDIFFRSNWFFGKIKFIRDANNVIKGFEISSHRARKMLFKKQSI